MKILQFTTRTCACDIRVGYMVGENRLVDINKADPTMPTTLLKILQMDLIDNVQKLASTYPPTILLSDVNIMSPITGMDKILCVGLNYLKYCEEHKMQKPVVPMMFNKFPSTVIGQSQAVKVRTEVTKKADWEVELAVIIGEKCTSVRKVDAFDNVAGYTIAQDISARDWQWQMDKNAGQLLLGKSMDTFCPLGPWMTTADEIPNPQNLNMTCTVNGVLKQKGNTEDMIHTISDVIARVTNVMTLLPGDVILTGTPSGVGMYRDPPECLRPGDILLSEIDKIGVLETKIERFESLFQPSIPIKLYDH